MSRHQWYSRSARLKIWLDENFQILMLCATVLELFMLGWIAYRA